VLELKVPSLPTLTPCLAAGDLHEE